jgi:hypothetical protein
MFLTPFARSTLQYAGLSRRFPDTVFPLDYFLYIMYITLKKRAINPV